jgi:vacuolar-type H+-ATPase subunit B/Vma2
MDTMYPDAMYTKLDMPYKFAGNFKLLDASILQ